MTFSHENQEKLLQRSNRNKKISKEYFPRPKSSCPSGLCGGYTPKEICQNLYPLKRASSVSKKNTRQDYSITPYSKVGR
jgi:hypothetical protein